MKIDILIWGMIIIGAIGLIYVIMFWGDIPPPSGDPHDPGIGGSI